MQEVWNRGTPPVTGGDEDYESVPFYIDDRSMPSEAGGFAGPNHGSISTVNTDHSTGQKHTTDNNTAEDMENYWVGWGMVGGGGMHAGGAGVQQHQYSGAAVQPQQQQHYSASASQADAFDGTGAMNDWASAGSGTEYDSDSTTGSTSVHDAQDCAWGTSSVDMPLRDDYSFAEQQLVQQATQHSHQLPPSYPNALYKPMPSYPQHQPHHHQRETQQMNPMMQQQSHIKQEDRSFVGTGAPPQTMLPAAATAARSVRPPSATRKKRHRGVEAGFGGYSALAGYGGGAASKSVTEQMPPRAAMKHAKAEQPVAPEAAAGGGAEQPGRPLRSDGTCCPFCKATFAGGEAGAIPSPTPAEAATAAAEKGKKKKKKSSKGKSAAETKEEEIVRQRCFRNRKDARRHNRQGKWWSSVGYDGDPYCQRCSEIFRDHIIRSMSNSANCDRKHPCHDCEQILTCFTGGRAAAYKKMEERRAKSAAPEKTGPYKRRKRNER